MLFAPPERIAEQVRAVLESGLPAVLDADVTGPSIPKAFGVSGMLMGSEDGILPAQSKTGVKIVSLNLLLENDTDPVVWRGPIIAGTVTRPA